MKAKLSNLKLFKHGWWSVVVGLVQLLAEGIGARVSLMFDIVLFAHVGYGVCCDLGKDLVVSKFLTNPRLKLCKRHRFKGLSFLRCAILWHKVDLYLISIIK